MSWTQSKTDGRAVMSVPIISTLGLGTWQVRDDRDLANPCGCSLCALVARGYKARIPTGQAGWADSAQQVNDATPSALKHYECRRNGTQKSRN